MAEGERVSASIANSRINVRGAAAGFMPVFQTLNSWESDPHPRLFSAVGIVLEVVQVLSFTLCPYFLYEQPIIKELVQFVWATIGPLWYRPFGPFALSEYIIVVIIAAVIVFATVLFFALLCLKKIESTNITVSNATRYAAECIAGFLFVPLMHLFLGGMSCSESRVVNFPGTSCGDLLHSATIGIGVVAIVAVAAIGLIISTTLSDTNPQSTKIRSRPHNYVEAAVLLVKLVLVIFFHILVERGAFASYNIIAVVAFSGLLVLHAVVLPFYHHTMTTIRCVTFAAAAFVGIVNCITAYCGAWFHLFHVNSFVLAALFPFAAYGGYLVSNMRLNPELTDKMSCLLNLATVPMHKAQFPFLKGVMSNDGKMIPIRFRTLESDIINENNTKLSATDEPTWDEIVIACSETLVPFIELVNRPTDAEVANRFLQLHAVTTNLAPSANILAFATRVYLKSIIRYKRSGIARFHFANFLYVYANRLNLALELLNEIDQQVLDEHDALVLYASYKVGVRVKELFGVRDNTHLHTFQRARQYHKDAMSDMALFWGKLMESKGDIVGLALLTNQLTERRQNASNEYERALMNQKGDRLLLSAYASFLENVMCDAQGAEAYRQLADDIAEEKKNRLMRGSRAKNDIPSAARGLIVDDDDDEDVSEESSASLLHNLLILLGVVALCSIAIFVMMQIRVSTASVRVEAISSIGSARSYAEQAVLQTLFANNERITEGCTNSTCTGTQFRESLYNLSLTEVSMRAYHNKATFGAHAVSRTSQAMSYASSVTMAVQLSEAGASTLKSIFSFFGQAASRTFTTLYEEATALDYVIQPWMNVHVISTEVTKMVNLMYAGGDFRRSFQWLTSSHVSSSLYSLGIFAQRHISDIDANAQVLQIGTAIVFVVTIVVLCCCFVAFYVSLRSIGHNKTTILKLFTLIPYPTQEMLQQAITTKIEQFEKLNADSDEKDVGVDQHEDDLMPDVDPLDDPTYEELQPNGRQPSPQRGVIQGKGMDDDVRRLSRFFGTARSTSLGTPTVFPSILRHTNAKSKGIRRKKHVQFKIDGEIHSAAPGKKLREPKVKLSNKPKDLVMDLERSIKDIERESAQESKKERLRKEQETEKMIYGGLRSQQANIKHPSGSTDSHATSTSARGDIIFRLTIGALMLASAVVLGISFGKISDAQLKYETSIDTRQSITVALRSYQSLEISALHFANFGRAEHYVAIYNYIAASHVYDRFKKLIAQDFDPVPSHLIEVVDHATQILERILNNLLGHLAVASRGLSANGLLDLSTVPMIATHEADNQRITNEFLIAYPRSVLDPNEFVFPGTFETTSNPALTGDNVTNIALRRLSSLKSMDDARAFDADMHDLSDGLVALHAQTASDMVDAVPVLLAVSIALSAVCAAALVVQLVRTVVFPPTTDRVKQVGFAATFGAMAVLCIVVLAMSASAMQSVSDMRDLYASYTGAINAAVDHRQEFFFRQRFLFQRYVSSDDQLTLFELGRDYTPSSIAAKYVALRSAIRDAGLSGVAAGTFSRIQTADLFMLQMQQVSLWLHNASLQKAANVTVSPPSPPFLATYDYSQEAGNAADSILYNSDATYQYSTPAIDKLRTARDLAIMSRIATTGRRAYTRFFAVFDSLSRDVIDPLYGVATSAILDASKKEKDKIQGALGCSAVVCFLGFFLASLPLLSFLGENIASNKLTQSMVDILFASILRRCQLALAFLAAIIVAQFAVAIITIDVGAQAGAIVKTARDREHLISNSLTSAIKMNASVANGNGVEYSQHLSALAEVREELSAARNKLYFAESATSTAFDVVSSLSSSQRDITFRGGALSLDSQYLLWLSNLDALQAVTVSVLAVVNPNNTMANEYTFTAASSASLSAVVDTLESSYYGLLWKLRLSNDQYDDDMKEALLRSRIPDVILMAALLLSIALQIYFVFIPVSEQLRDEEQGAKLMLNMIPVSVREAVPKIMMYLESGVLIEEDEEKQVYTRCPKAIEFVSMWGHSEDQSACFEVLNQSAVGQIIINTKGIVVFANKHIPDLLGYDDLEGRNISCLLDEPLRSLHDGFLKRFVTSGVSRIVGSGRDVVARTKSGDHVHLYLNLDEAVAADGTQYFLGALERYSVDDVKSKKKQADRAAAAQAQTVQQNSSEVTITDTFTSI